jgi:NAD(P)-dependent dehydrogenase (short-subunit alcohol dehydrogenase family)
MIDPSVLARFDLSGRIALITGASRGLGRHFALTLARAGARVAVAARSTDKLAELAAEVEALGGSALALAMDVTERASVCAALDRLASDWGVAQVVVNNAGIGGSKRPLEFNDADWASVVGTNLTGAWIVAQETSRRLVDAKLGGSIINVSSVLANRVAPGVSLYSASKAGLKHLTHALALELARHGIRFNSMAPGYFETDINAGFLQTEAGERLKSRIPAKRFGNLEDLEGALLLLASDAGLYMNGAEIVVDGGHLCNSL